MAHLAARSGYDRLVKRLNKFPQGAPPSKLLFEILRLLMSEKEASLVALVPIKVVHRQDGRPGLEDEPRGGAKDPRDAGRKVPASRYRRPDGPLLFPAAAHGRVFRVFHDEAQGRPRPESSGQALLPVHHRRGGFHQGSVHPGRNAARPGVRQRACPEQRPGSSRPRLRAGERSDQDRCPIGASASATAATRWSTRAGPATLRSISA